MSPLYLGSTEVTLPGGSSVLPSLFKFIQGNDTSASVTASATPHTKGAWLQLTASTPAASNLMFFTCAVSVNGSATGTLIDIGIGAAGAETVIAQNIAVGSHTSSSVINLPVSIPAGTRVAARVQSVVASKVALVIWALYSVPMLASAASLDSLGTDTATSLGTQTTNGSWVEIATAAVDYAYLVLVPSASTSATTVTGLYELGLGAAGSEVSQGEVRFMGSTNENITARTVSQSWGGLIFPGCSAGTRIAVKATTAAYHACVIGVPA